MVPGAPTPSLPASFDPLWPPTALIEMPLASCDTQCTAIRPPAPPPPAFCHEPLRAPAAPPAPPVACREPLPSTLSAVIHIEPAAAPPPPLYALSRHLDWQLMPESAPCAPLARTEADGAKVSVPRTSMRTVPPPAPPSRKWTAAAADNRHTAPRSLEQCISFQPGWSAYASPQSSSPWLLGSPGCQLE